MKGLVSTFDIRPHSVVPNKYEIVSFCSPVTFVDPITNLFFDGIQLVGA